MSWEAWTKQDGYVAVQQSDGTIITVKNDGITGYDFVVDYLGRMSKHYKNHLVAADAILRQQQGYKYNDLRKDIKLYNSNLALVSMNCAFGEMDAKPDCDDRGEFAFEFSRCPFRATCPYNGYAERNKHKTMVCCNPIYDAGLTERQAQIADLLVNTDYTLSQIAQLIGCSDANIRCRANEIYSVLSVNNRQGLTLLLKDKRLY